MRTALLTIQVILLFCLHLNAQVPEYTLVNTIKRPDIIGVSSLAIDKYDNVYGLKGSRVFKIKDGVALLEFKVNTADYVNSYNTLGSPWTVAVDDQLNIYLVNGTKQRIEKHDPNGKLINTFQLLNPITGKILPLHDFSINNLNEFVIFDYSSRTLFFFSNEGEYIRNIEISTIDPEYSSGNLIVRYDSYNKIYVAETKYTPEGGMYSTFQILDKQGNQIKKFGKGSANIGISTGDIAIDSRGFIYVSSASPNIDVFTPEVEFVSRFNVGESFELRHWRSRADLIVDSQNNLYAAGGRENRAILKFNPEHKLVEQWGKARLSYDVAFDANNNIYFIDLQEYRIIKTDRTGKIDPSFNNNDDDLIEPISLTVDTEDFVYVIHRRGNSLYSRKYDQSGKFVSSFINSGLKLEGNLNTAAIAVDGDGYIYATSWHIDGLYKYNKYGSLIAKYGYLAGDPGKLSRPKDISLDAAGNIYVLDFGGSRVQKFSPNGKLLSQYNTSVKTGTRTSSLESLSTDMFGNFCGVFGIDSPQKLSFFDIKGKQIALLPDTVSHNATLSNDSKLIVTYGEHNAIKIYSTEYTYNYNIIKGTIYHDKNVDCNLQSNEVGLNNIIVKATPGPYYGVTDTNGNYTILVEEGTYRLEPQLDLQSESKHGKVFKNFCYSSSNKGSISFSGFGNYASGNNIGVDITLSPYLTTSVSSTRRRRCFESTTKVTYANAGFAPAENAKVYLQLPKEVELISADKSYTKLPNGTYVFTVGTVAPGETKTITIQDKVTCGDESVRGLTVCTRAWISTGKLQEKPVAIVTGACDPATGRVRFVIRNTGPEDMETGKLFRIYRDGKLATVEQYKLAAGDSLVLWIPAVGKTLRLEAEQPDGNGENTLASATIEGCHAGGSNTPISLGFVNALPPDEEEPEVAEECLLITDSYDPNDKQVTPTGLTQENYTPTGVALTYKIRFQNTGTDVAYRVVVVDTLSENLDISTLQMGSASHNYRFDVSGKGKPVLTWTFDNIMLPDSNSNEPGSHGYIQFSIKPKADLPEKTLVENFADIFFDFNSPVRTNITANRIYDMPEVISEPDRLNANDIIATPGITGFIPESGKFGTEVIISGKKFSMDPALNKVFFNGLPATIVSASETELKVIVPANASSGNLKIQTTDGVAQSTDGFEVYQPPVLSSFSPKEGIIGTNVTLEGKHLTEAWLQTIKLGNQVCEIISRDGNSIVVKVPVSAVTGTFEAMTKGGETKTVDAFVVWHQPAINNLSKTTDKAGATIEISGVNFAPAPERNKVKFGTVPGIVLQASVSELKVQVPKGAENGPVTVETPGGLAESAVHFAFIPAPEVLAFTPATGTVGTDVTLTGKFFLTLGKPDTITFNGQKAVVLEATPTLLKVRVPRGASSGKIKVAGIGGYAVTADDFRIEELSPEQAIEVYPNPTTGNFTIRFVHADFEVHQVQLFSALGQLVYSEKVNSPRPDKLETKLAAHKPGMYILHIKTERGLVIKKLNVL